MNNIEGMLQVMWCTKIGFVLDPLDMCWNLAVFQERDSDGEKASWSWLPEAEVCLPVHSRNVSNHKKVHLFNVCIITVHRTECLVTSSVS